MLSCCDALRVRHSLTLLAKIGPSSSKAVGNSSVGTTRPCAIDVGPSGRQSGSFLRIPPSSPFHLGGSPCTPFARADLQSCSHNSLHAFKSQSLSFLFHLPHGVGLITCRSGLGLTIQQKEVPNMRDVWPLP